MYTNLDSDKSLEYIRKGLNSGVIRHGWRKDGIVDHFLLDALSIMWNKYYFELQELQGFTKKYFQMAADWEDEDAKKKLKELNREIS